MKQTYKQVRQQLTTNGKPPSDVTQKTLRNRMKGIGSQPEDHPLLNDKISAIENAILKRRLQLEMNRLPKDIDEKSQKALYAFVSKQLIDFNDIQQQLDKLKEKFGVLNHKYRFQFEDTNFNLTFTNATQQSICDTSRTNDNQNGMQQLNELNKKLTTHLVEIENENKRLSEAEKIMRFQTQNLTQQDLANKQEIEELKKQLKQYNAKTAQFEEDIFNQQKVIRQKEESCRGFAAEIQSLKSRIDIMYTENKQLQKTVLDQENQIVELNGKLSQLQMRSNQFSNQSMTSEKHVIEQQVKQEIIVGSNQDIVEDKVIEYDNIQNTLQKEASQEFDEESDKKEFTQSESVEAESESKASSNSKKEEPQTQQYEDISRQLQQNVEEKAETLVQEEVAENPLPEEFPQQNDEKEQSKHEETIQEEKQQEQEVIEQENSQKDKEASNQEQATENQDIIQTENQVQDYQKVVEEQAVQQYQIIENEIQTEVKEVEEVKEEQEHVNAYEQLETQLAAEPVAEIPNAGQTGENKDTEEKPDKMQDYNAFAGMQIDF